MGSIFQLLLICSIAEFVIQPTGSVAGSNSNLAHHLRVTFIIMGLNKKYLAFKKTIK